MIKINLLDWRQARREERQKNFLIALGGSALLGLAVVFGIVSKINGDIEFQNQRNQRLKQEIASLNKQIAEIDKLESLKADLLARMRIIEELQQRRTEIVHFFDELVTTTPGGVYLTTLKQNNSNTTVSGVAESNGRVSTYIRNLDGSDWFQNSELKVIKAIQQDRRRYSDFTLSFKPEKQKADAEENE